MLHKVSPIYTARTVQLAQAPGPAPAGFCLGLYRRFSLRYSPTSTVDFAVHSLVLSHTLGKDVSLDKHIFKPLVFFLKVGVVGEEAIDHFGRGLNVACFGHEAVVGAEFVVLFH